MPMTNKESAAPAKETAQSKNARREAETALAMKQEAERHAAAVRNMHRLRALRLSRANRQALRTGKMTGPGGMPIYKFQIGQTVFLTPSLSQNISGGAYIITKKLPERNGEFEYRVRGVNDPYERVVRESELSGVP